MRIISGKARGRKLRQFKGHRIRPTTDRVREAIFSSLQSRLGTFDGAKVLDLFAGTGALGLEALSRGAEFAVFVDQSIQSADIVTDNIKTCGMADCATLVKASVMTSLAKLRTHAPFDLIFLDPPYNQNLIGPVLDGIVKNTLLAKRGVICVESARDEAVPETIAGLVFLSRKEYGSTAVTFFALNQNGELYR